ncbi:hypothetical protein [Oryzomonas sagensis]|nr:hypothetical protein [Oryzomonas sagensis]
MSDEFAVEANLWAGEVLFAAIRLGIGLRLNAFFAYADIQGGIHTNA